MHQVMARGWRRPQLVSVWDAAPKALLLMLCTTAAHHTVPSKPRYMHGTRTHSHAHVSYRRACAAEAQNSEFSLCVSHLLLLPPTKVLQSLQNQPHR